MVLTNSLGAVIHKENWIAFITARRPCLAWYGGESLNQLLREIRKKRETINSHLAQLHVTETVIHYAEERPIDRVSVTELEVPGFGDMAPADAQRDLPVLAWELLNFIANDTYTAEVGEATLPDSVMDVFEQDEFEVLAPPVGVPLPEAARPLTPESMVDTGEGQQLWPIFYQ